MWSPFDWPAFFALAFNATWNCIAHVTASMLVPMMKQMLLRSEMDFKRSCEDQTILSLPLRPKIGHSLSLRPKVSECSGRHASFVLAMLCRDLASKLGAAFQNRPDLRPTICRALTTICLQNRLALKVDTPPIVLLRQCLLSSAIDAISDTLVIVAPQ